MPASIDVRRGEIYPLRFDASGKSRPVLVVSRDALNRGHYVLVVPFYSRQLEKRKQWKSCAYFSKGEGNLDRDCVAKADEVGIVSKSELLLAKRIGRLDAKQLERVVEAIRFVLGDDT